MKANIGDSTPERTELAFDGIDHLFQRLRFAKVASPCP